MLNRTLKLKRFGGRNIVHGATRSVLSAWSLLGTTHEKVRPIFIFLKARVLQPLGLRQLSTNLWIKM
jgi:hypothetical protein